MGFRECKSQRGCVLQGCQLMEHSGSGYTYSHVSLNVYIRLGNLFLLHKHLHKHARDSVERPARLLCIAPVS